MASEIPQCPLCERLILCAEVNCYSLSRFLPLARHLLVDHKFPACPCEHKLPVYSWSVSWFALHLSRLNEPLDWHLEFHALGFVR